MTGRTIRRLLAGTALAFTMTTGLAVTAPTPALADSHDHITIRSERLPEPVSVGAEDRPEAHEAVLMQVDWLTGRSAGSREPEPDTLGPGYELVVHEAGEPRHRFQLYPLAEGGPRVFRPAGQPGDRTVDEAWFLGRLSMPEAFREAGVPVTEDPPPDGGVGGGAAPAAPVPSSPPAQESFGVVDQWRQGMLLTIGVAVAMAAGVASVALLVRR